MRPHVLRRFGGLIVEHNQFVGWADDGRIGFPMIVGEFVFVGIRRQFFRDLADLSSITCTWPAGAVRKKMAYGKRLRSMRRMPVAWTTLQALGRFTAR